jgi:2-dehydropantoate 2-reductase
VNVLVAGTGGVGGYFGARLARNGHRVFFLARGDNLVALKRDGLRVLSRFGDVRLPLVEAGSKGADAGPVDAVLFCVKTYDNEETAGAIAGAVAESTTICSLQNGVENESFLSGRFPRAVVIGGVARVESWLDAPGIIVQRGSLADLRIGAFDDRDRPAVVALAGAFEGTPVPVEVTDDIESALWLKLVVIAGLGGVTAYCRCPIGRIREDRDLRDLLIRAMQEAEAVARRRGVSLPSDPVGSVVRSLDQALDPDARSSMARDVERGRPLEVEAISGAVVRFGEEAGVPTPANRTILDALLPVHRAALARRARDRG